MSPKVLIPIAHGSEELEAVTLIDVLRRAGAEVVVAAVGGQLQITCSRGVEIVADRMIEGCGNEDFDCIALPGGTAGAQCIRDSAHVTELLKNQDQHNKYIAAICAAPAIVLLFHDLIRNRPATCHPSFSSKLENQEMVNERVVVEGNLITSRGPGTALEFSLTLVRLLFNEKTEKKIAQAMVA